MKITIIHNNSSITYEEQRVQTEYYQVINGDENTNRILSVMDKLIEGIVKINSSEPINKR